MKLKIFFNWVIVLIIVICLVGCTNEGTDKNTNQVTDELNEESTQVEEADGTRVIEDMAGRKIEIPEDLNRVYGVNNNATYMLYTLVPEKMIGWNVELSDEALEFIEEPYKDLPVLGTLYGNADKASPEEILAYEPDIIIISDQNASDKCVKTAEDIQNTTEIPVIIIENAIDKHDEAYELLGSVFSVEEKAEALSAFYAEAYDFAVNNVPEESEQKNVYYARTKDGLGTDFAGSYHTEILALIGVNNVAINENSDTDEQSGNVTMEQVIEWNPEVIIVGQMGATQADTYNKIMSEATWSGIDAVANEAVYAIPNKPFNWFDRPPSVNRIIGIKYIGHLLYPEIYDIDISEYVREFFELFYRYELSDEELAELLGV